ncbi:MAG: kinase [Natronohydrobacter sp.]|nr:kinase [Natronohydrobacter sp.]
MDRTPDILCLGAAHWDVIGRSAAPVTTGDDLPGVIRTRPGGVALNIAHALAGQGLRPALLSAIGRDAEGVALVDWLQATGIDTRFLHRPETLPTDRYMAIEGPEGLVAAIADSTALENDGANVITALKRADLAHWRGPVVLDSGFAPDLLAELAERGIAQATPLRLTSAAPAKAHRLRPFLQSRATFTLNRHEAATLLGHPLPDSMSAAHALLTAGAARAIITDGAHAATDADGHRTLTLPPPIVPLQRVTGAGDVFLAAHIAAEAHGLDRSAALAHALQQAAHHVATPDA